MGRVTGLDPWIPFVKIPVAGAVVPSSQKTDGSAEYVVGIKRRILENIF
jgi:hypothetical protein